MEIVFVRHGHGEHLNEYPSRLHTLHPRLTELGKLQVRQLKETLHIEKDTVILVSPTVRTIETALILAPGHEHIITPLVGPRMFPLDPELPVLACDQILSKQQMIERYPDATILDLGIDCWEGGINCINQQLFVIYGRRLFNWMRDQSERIVIVSHDGTITQYRLLLGESGLSRSDFLGEAGVYSMVL